MPNYLTTVDDSQALTIAIRYLEGGAQEWWILFKGTEEGRAVTTWCALKNALVCRLETLNKEKIARDKLAKWKKLKT